MLTALPGLPEAKTKSLHLRSAAESRSMRFLPAPRFHRQHCFALKSQAREIETSCGRKLQEINKAAVVHKSNSNNDTPITKPTLGRSRTPHSIPHHKTSKWPLWCCPQHLQIWPAHKPCVESEDLCVRRIAFQELKKSTLHLVKLENQIKDPNNKTKPVITTNYTSAW